MGNLQKFNDSSSEFDKHYLSTSSGIPRNPFYFTNNYGSCHVIAIKSGINTVKLLDCASILDIKTISCSEDITLKIEKKILYTRDLDSDITVETSDLSQYKSMFVAYNDSRNVLVITSPVDCEISIHF